MLCDGACSSYCSKPSFARLTSTILGLGSLLPIIKFRLLNSVSIMSPPIISYHNKTDHHYIILSMIFQQQQNNNRKNNNTCKATLLALSKLDVKSLSSLHFIPKNSQIAQTTWWSRRMTTRITRHMYTTFLAQRT